MSNNVIDKQVVGFYDSIKKTVQKHGVSHALEILSVLNDKKIESKSKLFLQLNNQITQSVYLYGFDYLYLFFNKNKNEIYQFNKNEKEFLKNATFEIIEEVFGKKVEVLLNSTSRKGSRVYATGVLFILLIDLCGFEVKEVIKITNKPSTVISRHKGNVIELRHNITDELAIIKQFYKAKHKLINVILNEIRKPKRGA